MGSHRNGVLSISELVGPSEAAQAMRRQVADVLDSIHPVLLYGPHGAGQQAIANAIHRADRPDGPWVVRDAAPLEPDDLATILQAAQHGSFVVQDVDRLKPSTQQALNKAISENGLGTARLISICHDDLPELAAREQFEPKLVPMIAVHEIALRALDDRLEDKPSLIDHFVADAVNQDSFRDIEIGDEVKAAIDAHQSVATIEQLRSLCHYFVRGIAANTAIAPSTLGALTQTRNASRKGRWSEQVNLLANELSALEDHTDLDEIQRKLSRACWLAAQDYPVRRSVLAELAKRFQQRFGKKSVYNGVLRLIMLDYLKAEPSATRDSMLNEVRRMGLMGASPNYLYKHLLPERRFDVLVERARTLDWRPDDRIAPNCMEDAGAGDALLDRQPSVETVNAERPSFASIAVTGAHHAISRVRAWATRERRHPYRWLAMLLLAIALLARSSLSFWVRRSAPLPGKLATERDRLYDPIRRITAGEAVTSCKADPGGSVVQVFERGWFIYRSYSQTIYVVSRDERDAFSWESFPDNSDATSTAACPMLVDGGPLLEFGFRKVYCENYEYLQPRVGAAVTREETAWLQFQQFSGGLLIHGVPKTKRGVQQQRFFYLMSFFLTQGGHQALASQINVNFLANLDPHCSSIWYPTARNRDSLPSTALFPGLAVVGDCRQKVPPQAFFVGRERCSIFGFPGKGF